LKVKRLGLILYQRISEAGRIFSSLMISVLEAGVIEPLIYYHFKDKDDLFSHILEMSFKEYFSRLKTLEREPRTRSISARKMSSARGKG
jgi:hypothetical protein